MRVVSYMQASRHTRKLVHLMWTGMCGAQGGVHRLVSAFCPCILGGLWHGSCPRQRELPRWGVHHRDGKQLARGFGMSLHSVQGQRQELWKVLCLRSCSWLPGNCLVKGPQFARGQQAKRNDLGLLPAAASRAGARVKRDETTKGPRGEAGR